MRPGNQSGAAKFKSFGIGRAVMGHALHVREAK